MNTEEVLRRQVPLDYLLQALGHESKEDVVMRLQPFESESFSLPLERTCEGTRFGSPLEHSGVFATLFLAVPHLFEMPEQALDPAATTRNWLENAVYLIPEVCLKGTTVIESKTKEPRPDGAKERVRRTRTLLKSQAHVHGLFKNKSFHEDDFFLFMALHFGTQIAVYDVIQRTSVLYNSTNKEKIIVLLNINGQFEAWRSSAGPPNFSTAREFNRVPSRAGPRSAVR